jgi:adhesin/invasin
MLQSLRNAMAKNAVVLGIVAVSGCGGFGGSGGGSGGSTIPPIISKTPVQIVKVSGDGQSALPGATLSSPLTVVVQAQDGSGVQGVTVTFAVASGGGTISATSATSDAQGLAQTSLTLGATAGQNTVTASASNNGTALGGSPLTFTETGTTTPPPPSGPTYVADLAPLMAAACNSCHTPGQGSYSGADLSTYAAIVNGQSMFGHTPAAYITNGNPASSLLYVKCVGTSQGLQMPSGGTPLTAAQLSTISTWITNGAPYSSSTTGATQIQKTSGDGQAATAGGMLANPFVVTVLNSGNQPVAGFTVAWTITAGAGTLSASSTTTNASGQAQTTLTTGLVAGTNTVTASASGLTGSPVTFNATGAAGPASKLASVSGNNQTMPVGTKLSPFVVKVTDMAGNSVQGANVTFAMTAGSGTLSASSAVTDATGQAATTLTLGTAAGNATVTASSGALTGSPSTFTATGTAGAAKTIAISSGNNQNGTAGSALGQPLAVLVTDASGNPVSGVAVAFNVTQGAGKLAASNVNTGANGVASAAFTLDTKAGQNSVQASSTGLTGSPLVFTELGNPGAATSLAKLSGDTQTAIAGTKLPNPLVVVIKDANGNPVPNVAISFAVTTGGGTLSGASTATDASGQGQASLTLGTTAGNNTITVSSAGLTAVVFTETGTPMTAPTMSTVTGNAQSGVAGTALSTALTVVVKDMNGNPVANQPVTFAVTAGGGTLSNVSAATNSSGQATATLTLGKTAGTNADTVSVSAAGVNGSPQIFSESATAGAAAKLVKLSGDAQNGVAGAALATALVTQVQDTNGNAVQGVNVTLSASSGATVTPSSAASDAMGKVSATFTLSKTAGANSLTASATGLTAVIFNETGNAGAAATVAIFSGNNQAGGAGTALPNPLVVMVNDANANPVAGVNVTFAATAGGGTLSPASMATGANGQAQTSLTPGSGNNTVTATVTGLTPASFTETGNAAKRYYTTDIQPIFAASCANCHTPGQGTYSGADLSTFAAMTTGTTKFAHTITNYVVANNPAQSLLYAKVAGTTQGLQMPTTGALAAAQIQIFSDWISQGAPLSGAGAPASIAKTAGDAQSGPVGATLPTALAVVVKDPNGLAVPGATVTFAPTGGTVSPTSLATDVNGAASTVLTLGSTAGAVTVTATVNGTAFSVVFNETANAAVAKALVKTAGDNQSATDGTVLATKLVTQVQDATGKPVANILVSFAASSGASVSPTSANSDASGNVTATFTLSKTAGPNTLTASSAGLTAVVFNETSKVGPAAQVAVFSGNNQVGTDGTALSSPLVALVTDANSNPVSGVNVMFAATSGGGSVSPASMATGANGQAQTTLTLGAAAGTNTVSATVTGLTAASFTETGQSTVVKRYYTTDIAPLFASAAANCVVCHTAGGTAANAPLDTYLAVTTGTTKYSHTITNYVVSGNPAQSLVYAKIAGTTQGAQMPLGMAALSAAQMQIVSDWISQGAPQSAAGPPATIAISTGNNQAGPAGTTLPVGLAVVVKDSNGTAVPGANVSFVAKTGGGSVNPTSALTDSNGMASTMLTLGAVAGANTVTATVNALVTTFTETGNPSSYSGAPLTGSTNPIDVQALAVLKAANVEPAPLSSDQEFVRRVTADLLGRLPTENEMTTFVNDPTAGKRSTKIDSLLADPAFATHWATDIFSAWACVHTSSTSVAAFNTTIASELAKDTPISTLVQDMVTGGGAVTTIVGPSGAALTWGQIWDSTFTTYNDTAQVDQLMLTFTGMTSECGRCHDHHLTVSGQDDPMWTQNDNYGLYAYFSTTNGGATKVDTSGKAFGAPVSAHFVADGYANTTSSTVVVGGVAVPMTVANTPMATRRSTFAGILTASNAFARGTAHRIFAEVMDPLLDPNQFLGANLDAMSEPALLGVLTTQFKNGGFSLKAYLRVILNSVLYQLTTDATKSGTTHDNILARRTVRRHHGEVLEQGVYAVAEGTADSYVFGNFFETQFGYPVNRQTILDRTDAVNIGQAFVLNNTSGGSIVGLASQTNAKSQVSNATTGLATQVTNKTITLNQAITTLFHYALSRDPTATELTNINTIEAGQTPLVALNDVADALCSTAEFISR